MPGTVFTKSSRQHVCEFANVVLSRKGIDSKAGGSYSPFDPQTGVYLVLPIPMDEEECDISNTVKYGAINIRRGYLPGIQAGNLASLMQAMGKRPRIKRAESNYAHLDPWLGRCPWLAEDSNHSVGAFGQVGTAQAHLHNRNVNEGSLFLFFSRFTPIPERRNLIVPSFGPEHLGKGLYFIYGWLKVRRVIQQYEAIDDVRILSHHPHATKRYFQKYAHKEGAKNTIYMADRFLFNDGSGFPGCGYFRRLNKHLLLTATASAQEPSNWIASRWSLPGFFSDRRPSFLQRRPWSMCRDGSCLVETSGQWQEAVFAGGQEFRRWFLTLLTQNADNV